MHHFSDIGSSASTADWVQALRGVPVPAGMLDQWRLAVVLDAKGQVGWLEGSVVRRNNASQSGGEPRTGVVQAKDMAWARRFKPLRVGDVVMVQPQAEGGHVALMQVPVVEGAIVTMNARTGRVLALVGGWSFQASQFDRSEGTRITLSRIRVLRTSFTTLSALALLISSISSVLEWWAEASTPSSSLEPGSTIIRPSGPLASSNRSMEGTPL